MNKQEVIEKGVNTMSTIKKWEKMTQKSDIKDLAKKLGV